MLRVIINLINGEACISDWYYGSSAESAGKAGLFPKSAVVSANESMLFMPSEALAIVRELTDVLNEWWSTVKVGIFMIAHFL